MAYPVEIPDPRLRAVALLAAAMLPPLWAITAFITCSGADSVEIDGLVYVNTAPVESLVRLPGTGVRTAQSIVDYRKASGKPKAFANAGDLCEVKGIGEKKAGIIEPYLSFE